MRGCGVGRWLVRVVEVGDIRIDRWRARIRGIGVDRGVESGVAAARRLFEPRVDPAVDRTGIDRFRDRVFLTTAERERHRRGCAKHGNGKRSRELLTQPIIDWAKRITAR